MRLTPSQLRTTTPQPAVTMVRCMEPYPQPQTLTRFFCPFKGLMLLGGYFVYIFSGFAIDRSKKYIKTIKNYIKIDAVDPWAAVDNPPPPPPGHNG